MEAVFRFYEELNDFLPERNRKVPVQYQFRGTPSVKEAIEAIGVPHVEVDLILANSKSVAFNYLLRNNDRISVYPVFETLNIAPVTHLRAKPLRKTRFILDVHLGKLAKYLRLLGFDTLYRNDYDDPEIIKIALAEHRIILTRDIGILKVKVVTHGYFIRSQKPRLQLTEVLKHFDLQGEIKPFSRCVKCNGRLSQVDKKSILNQLEPLTKKYYTTFFRCTVCHQIFWEGSHFARVKKFVDSYMKRP